MSETERRNRSVLDYATEGALTEALTANARADKPNSTHSDTDSMTASVTNDGDSVIDSSPSDSPSDNWSVDDNMDWRIDDAGPGAYEQTVEQEVQRLIALRSYQVLDMEEETAREMSFDRFTTMGARLLNTSGCLITLIDLGRSYNLSRHGVFLTEYPRRNTFCAHVVLSKEDIFVVPDARTDERFKDNAFVTAEGGIRFYAAAPLRSPEGYNLGAFCVIDSVPRPQGLTKVEQDSLRDMAKYTVDTFVHYRKIQQQKAQLDTASKLLAAAAHNLLTPMSGLQLSLSLLSSDEDFQDKLKDHHKDYISTVTSCASTMESICEALRNQSANPQELLQKVTEEVQSSNGMSPTTCNFPRLVDKLNEALSTVSKRVPVTIQVHTSVPHEVEVSEVRIFRVLLFLLALSCERLQSGSISLAIGLDSTSRITFVCERTGREPGQEAGQDPKTSSIRDYYEDAVSCSLSDATHGSKLELVASEIQALGGELAVHSSDSVASQTSEFAFSLPFQEYLDRDGGEPKRPYRTSEESMSASTHSLDRVPSDTSIQPPNRTKRALVIDDSLVVRRMLVNALSKLGFVTSQAADGMQGLQLMQESPFNLVLCDFLMPVMDGLDCVREYRRWEKLNRPYYKQYIVGMSAHASNNDVERGTSLGMNHYLSKPVTMDNLRALERAIELDDNYHIPSERSVRQTIVSTTSFRAMQKQGENVCLIASADPEQCRRIHAVASKHGWNAVTSPGGHDTLKLLKCRNWGAVLLDCELPELSGLSCINQFREWEKNNRVLRQKNLILLSTGFALTSQPSSISLVQLPDGVDGALSKLAAEEDLEATFRNIDCKRLTFEAKDFVTR